MVEIRDSALILCEQMEFPVEVDTQELDVESGVYAIRIESAGGEVGELFAEVGEDEIKELYVEPPPTKHEWMSFQAKLGLVTPSETESESKQLSVPRTSAGQPMRRSRSFDGVWLRLWYPTGSGWEPTSGPEGLQESRLDNKSGYAVLRFYPERMQPRVIQVGGKLIPWRCVLIPPGGEPTEVLLRLAESRAHRSVDPLHVTVSSRDATRESLLLALKGGNDGTSRVMTGLFREDLVAAEDRLRDKMSDPAMAAVGGYCLLRYGAFERLHDWPKNLANWFDWMPDGCIIHAWQLLRDPERRSETCARENLIEAARRGVPFFTEGLRLLRDGLSYFANTHRWADEDRPDTCTDQDDPPVRDALRRVHAYATAADWGATTTTYRGVDPASPAEKPQRGLPEEVSELWYMQDSEAEEEEDVVRKSTQGEYSDLLLVLQATLGQHVSEVRFSGRLADAAAALVSLEAGVSLAVENMLRRMGRDVRTQKRILELNPQHAVVMGLKRLFDQDANSPRIADYAELLFGQALLAEGSPLPDATRYATLVTNLLVRDLES